MPMPKEMREKILKELDEQYDRVCKCPMTPGSLEKELVGAVDDLSRLIQEDFADSASKEADFPPSGLPALRRQAPLRSRETESEYCDREGQNSR